MRSVVVICTPRSNDATRQHGEGKGAKCTCVRRYRRYRQAVKPDGNLINELSTTVMDVTSVVDVMVALEVGRGSEKPRSVMR